jgi:WD40 repeat protein
VILMNLAELRKSLLDYDYLQTKLNTTDTETLIAECDLFPDDEVIKLIKYSLRMSWHVFNEDKTALAHQLVGRLMGWRSQHPEISTFTDSIAKHVPGIYPKDLDSPYFSHNPAGGALLRVLTGNTFLVNSENLSADGKFIVSGYWDKTLRLWDANSGALLKTLTEHTSTVTSANFSADGKLIVSASGNIYGDSKDNTVRIWDAHSGALLKTLEGHTAVVFSANFSADGQLIVSASRDKTVRIWDVHSGTLLNTLTGHTSSVSSTNFSADGKFIVSASYDKTVRIWDASSGALLKTLEGHTSFVFSANFSADGKFIVSASGNIYGDSKDNTVRIWEVASGQEIDEFEDTEAGRQQALHKYPQFTQIGETTYKHANGRVLDRSGQKLTVRDGQRTYTFYGDANIWSAAWSPDGVHLVVGDVVGRVISLRVQE